MSTQEQSWRSRWKGVARKFAVGVAAAGLAATMSVGTAFATDILSTTYPLPKADQVKTFQHKATDNGHEYTYEYVTVGSAEKPNTRIAPMMGTWYEIVGLNYINNYRGVDTIFEGTGTTFYSNTAAKNEKYTTGNQGSFQSRSSALVLTGTDVNINPDEYMWNYCCWANGAEVSPDSRSIDHGNSGGVAALSVVTSEGEIADFPRPIYAECNLIDASGEADTYGDYSYVKWIELENARDNRPKTGTYDPYFSKLSVGGNGAASTVKQVKSFAAQIDGVIAQSKDSNNNYTLQTRYGGNTADGAQATVEKFEDLIQATQYYTLARIADGSIAKAVTADIVGYDPATHNYACRVYAVNDADKDLNVYGGRLAGYLGDISTSITELGLPTAQDPTQPDSEGNYVRWYTPEQIVENCDALFACDCPSTNTVGSYLAYASDNKRYGIYTPGTLNEAGEDNTADLFAARDAAQKAGKKVAKFCLSYPANSFGNVYAQGSENSMLALVTTAFAYPEIYGNQGFTDLMAYWAKYVWHVKDSQLQSIVESACFYMSGDLEVVKISSDFEKMAKDYFDQGNSYYLANKSAVDAVNYGNMQTSSSDDLWARTPNYQTISVASDSVSTKMGGAAVALAARANGGGALSYKTSNANVATVDANGNVTPVGVGAATITVAAEPTSSYARAYKAVNVTVAQGDAQVVTTAVTDKVTKAFGSKNFSLGAATSGDGALTYSSSNPKVATIAADGTVTITGLGSTTLTVNAAATNSFKAGTKKVELTVTKGANPMTVKATNKTLKAAKVKKAKQTFKALTVSNAKGTVTYKKASGSNKITVNAKNGKITVAKNTPKKKYTVKVKVTAKGNAQYKSASKTVSLKVTVK